MRAAATPCTTTGRRPAPNTSPDLLELGARSFRVEFVNESADEVTRTFTRYAQLLRGEITGAELWRELKLINQLGVTRGQMETAPRIITKKV
jgi:putative protease